ncbi:hypothetical protein GWI33_008864 [Rhynchophorus ferrugineus]|uniref:Uncharacterized protein n=1 Tax=Rhynchophorus ferrugineus TaxID=354439 RepID=A0A834MFN4_RHYFE|nr:hypothetical protein GWI33_008864 [Rhynchophorus ferrugineus]
MISIYGHKIAIIQNIELEIWRMRKDLIADVPGFLLCFDDTNSTISQRTQNLSSNPLLDTKQRTKSKNNNKNQRLRETITAVYSIIQSMAVEKGRETGQDSDVKD